MRSLSHSGTRTLVVVLSAAMVTAIALTAGIALAVGAVAGRDTPVGDSPGAPLPTPIGAPRATGIDGPYDVQGIVTTVTAGATPAMGSLLVEGDGGVTCDKGAAAITAATTWYEVGPDGARPIAALALQDLRGRTVGVLYDGAVAESYPVQGTAAAIVLLPTPL